MISFMISVVSPKIDRSGRAVRVTIALESIGLVLSPSQGRSFHPVSARRGVRAM
jgi:hypothetical protein